MGQGTAARVQHALAVAVAITFFAVSATWLVEQHVALAGASGPAARAYGGDQPPGLADRVPRARPVVQGGRAVARATPAPLGEPLLTIAVPRLWGERTYAVVEGVRPGDLARGPGHYPGTAMPGERGNVAIAAHRYAGPFLDFERLRAGDEVVLGQGGASWTYVIGRRPRVIDATDVGVVAPVAGRALTLTTCWPKYGDRRRTYVRAHLVERTGA